MVEVVVELVELRTTSVARLRWEACLIPGVIERESAYKSKPQPSVSVVRTPHIHIMAHNA
eukprot:COSAG01_NODE_29796_length_629_cov_1.300000_1_plen_59_part_10